MNISEKKVSPAMEKLLLLKSRIPFFAGLTNQEIITLIENVKIVQFHANSIIVEEGSSVDDDIFFLLKGSVLVIKSNGKDNIKLAELDNPGIFGEMRAITNEVRSTTIKAGKEGVLTICFNIKKMKDTGKALFYKNIIDDLSKKILNMNEKIKKV